MSATVGFGNSEHNVDSRRTSLNAILRNTSIEHLYDREFGKALADYNNRQTRSDRRIENYLEKIRSGKQENESYELVVMIGNRDTNPATDTDCRIISTQIYDSFVKEFEKKYPSLKVFQAVVHNDESTPHLHLGYVPVSTGNTRGLETKNSLRGAMKQLGFNDVRDFNRDIYKVLERVARGHGILRLEPGCDRAHLNVRDFKAHVEEIGLIEDYPYNNDPKLMHLLEEQHFQICNNLDALNESQRIIEAVIKAPLVTLAKVAREARIASEALFPRFDRARATLKRTLMFAQAIPDTVKDFILNPAPGGHREAINTKQESLSLAEVGKEVKEASNHLEQVSSRAQNATARHESAK
jgi:hypothetical protein